MTGPIFHFNLYEYSYTVPCLFRAWPIGKQILNGWLQQKRRPRLENNDLESDDLETDNLENDDLENYDLSV